jgi:hypothetical protein
LQRVVWILAAVVGTVWVASELPAPDSPAPASCETRWRRTRDGWERAEQLLPPIPPPRSPGVHPLVLAAAEILGSVFVLAASRPRQPRCGAGR